MPSWAPALALRPDQKSELEGLARNGSTPQKVALRCRLLLLAHDGIANQLIAEQLSLSRPTVLALRHAFAKDGLAAVTGIRKRKRTGRVLTPELVSDLPVIPGVWQRPRYASGLGGGNVIVNRALRDRTTAADLMLAHPEGMQPQYFLQLAHVGA